MNWGGGKSGGLIMFWFQVLVYLFLLINIFVITVLKNHRWYGYARYKVCPLLCDTYLESGLALPKMLADLFVQRKKASINLRGQTYSS